MWKRVWEINYIFWAEIRSGFEEPCGTPRQKFPGVPPLPVKIIELIYTRKVEHFPSFWKWEFLELGNSLVTLSKSSTNNLCWIYSLHLKLWNLMMPHTPLKERICKQWGDIGFQGTDPQTDFRGMGKKILNS